MLIVDHIAGGPTDDCAVEIYSNGGAEPWRTLALPEATERGLRHVLCVPEAHHPACTAVFGGSAFNGNDALRLRCGAVTQDLFGVIGSDPGTEWTGIGIAGISIGTADQGLWRCLDPTPEQTPSFELSEWTAWDPSGDPSLLAPDCVDPSGQDGAGGWAGAGSAESFD
jgi:hypothetical protein